MSVVDQLNLWAERTPDSTAIAFGGQCISFAELRDRVERAGRLLANQYNVRHGDRVAWIGLNHPDMLVLFFACAELGAIFNPLNSRLARDEYNFLLRDAEPKVCFFDTHFEEMVQQLETGSWRFLPNSALDEEPAKPLPQFKPAAENAPLLLVYTSGTTGKPKGVVLGHRAVEANIENCLHLYAFAPGQRVQITLPLFHVGGLCILLLPALTHGATIHLHERFDPAVTLNEIEQEKITTSIFVPAQMAAMMSLPQWTRCDLSSMSHVAVGSSIIPLNQIRNFHDKGVPVSQVYGATETGPTAIALEVKDAKVKEGSAGTVAKLCKIEVRSPDGDSCSDTDNGEIWISGPNILSSYWNNPEETAKVLVDGWYNTGDIGHRDRDGFYWIVDRSKDVIISGGENIYPAEVEAVLLEHPAIAAIAIVGRPDEKWGETPVAAVELVPGASLTHDEMNGFLENRIARYKRPKEIRIFAPLPRNAMGKIEKPVLRKMVKPQGSCC